MPGPGGDLFETAARELPGLELIAEDLGAVTPEVIALRERFDLPGLRVLQFAFGTDGQSAEFLPHNYPRRCVAYSGTHDNDTTRGWLESSSRPDERERALRYLQSDRSAPHWDMLKAVLGSTADTAILTAQDLLGLDGSARMNLPGSASGNWRWRLKPGQLDDGVASRLRTMTESSGRSLEMKV
jgi:4-alpha-glucanotransferase